MHTRGHPTWSRATVSEIERGNRAVTVDELLSLSEVFCVEAAVMLAPPRTAPPAVGIRLSDVDAFVAEMRRRGILAGKEES